MTNPFGVAKWNDAGWRPPTPHEVYSFLSIVSIAVPILGITPPGSMATKVCELLALVCGQRGIAAAKNFLSPQVLRKLEAADERAFAPNSTTTINAQGGPIRVAGDVSVTP